MELTVLLNVPVIAVYRSMDEMSRINHNDNTGNCLAPGTEQMPTNVLFISLIPSFENFQEI